MWSFFRNFDLFVGYPSVAEAFRDSVALDTKQATTGATKNFLGAIMFDHVDANEDTRSAGAGQGGEREMGGGEEDGASPASTPADFNPSYSIRLPAGDAPSTSSSRVWVGYAWGAYTWYLYYYSGFLLMQDLVDKALIAHAIGNSTVAASMVAQFPVFAQQMPTPFYVSDVFAVVIGAVLPLVATFSWVQSFTTFVKGLVHEREKSLTDSMVTYGLGNGVNAAAWFISTVGLFTINSLFLVFYLHRRLILPKSNVFLVFILFELFAIASVCMGFAVSTLFSRARLASAASGVIYLASFIPFLVFALAEASMSRGLKIGISLFPPTAFGVGAYHIARLEQSGTGLQWSNLNSGLGSCDNYNVGICFGTLILDIVLYSLLAWYATAVGTGVPGARKNAFFCIYPSYWHGMLFSTQSAAHQLQPHAQLNPGSDFAIQEEVGSVTNQRASNVGVVMDAVEVVYRRGRGGCGEDVHALKGLSLELQKGTLTTLLGHNGAGKTTAISAMIGAIAPSTGTITVNGHDVTTHLAEARADIGVCPQYDTVFEGLTVREHLYFVGRLRGLSKPAIEIEIAELLDAFSLENKANSEVTTLSGGTKRKVSLMMAFIGSPATLVLDEPTAGMDPEARRRTWDLLLARKRKATILLTTHYMDEADVLSDQVAILSNGKLKCRGSPLELKEQFGGVYNLTVQLAPGSDATQIAEMVMSGPVKGATTITPLSHTLRNRYHAMDVGAVLVEGTASISRKDAPRAVVDGGGGGGVGDSDGSGGGGSAGGIDSASHKDGEEREDMISFALPATETRTFAPLLGLLEASAATTGIVNLGIVAPSLERVFLNILDADTRGKRSAVLRSSIGGQGSNETRLADAAVTIAGSDMLMAGSTCKGDDDVALLNDALGVGVGVGVGTGDNHGSRWRSDWSKTKALLKKREISARRDIWTTIPHLLLPIIFIILAMVMVRSFSPSTDEPALDVRSVIEFCRHQQFFWLEAY
jgi:ABC-type multidrug transport system ATPase subunit